MQVKQSVTIVHIPQKEHAFLTNIESKHPSELTGPQWNKLYAILAEKRERGSGNVWIYSGLKWEYDVTNRSYAPAISAEGTMSIGNILRGKQK